MVFERRDILVAQQRGHPHVRLRHRRDAAFFKDPPRLEVVAKSLQRLFEIPLLPGTPSLLRDEESMLDGIASDARLPVRSTRTGRARGVTLIGFESALSEGKGPTTEIGKGGCTD